MKRIFTVLAGLFSLALALLLISLLMAPPKTPAPAPAAAVSSTTPPAAAPAAPLAKLPLTINGVTFHVDHAETEAEQEQGLGGRDSLPQDGGMLFTFATSATYPFWMKGMRFPLDFIWIAADGKIAGVTENVDPQIGAPESDLKLYLPPSPVTRVLEVAAGTVKLISAKAGDSVEPFATSAK